MVSVPKRGSSGCHHTPVTVERPGQATRLVRHHLYFQSILKAVKQGGDYIALVLIAPKPLDKCHRLGDCHYLAALLPPASFAVQVHLLGLFPGRNLNQRVLTHGQSPRMAWAISPPVA